MQKAIVALNVLFAMIVLGFTAYVVFWLDRSGWWFLLAFIIVSSMTEYLNDMHRACAKDVR